MILKSIFQFLAFVLWTLPLGIIKVLAENMEYIYLYLYFGYGVYMVHVDKPIDNKYLFLGMWVIVVFFVHYIVNTWRSKS